MVKINRVTKGTTVYKAAYTSKHKPCLVVLKLPKGTRINRSISSTWKNRAEKAVVLGIYRIEVKTGSFNYLYCVRGDIIKRAYSSANSDFIYEKGKTVTPRLPFDESHKECASGIHFFTSKDRAKGYLV